MVISKHWMAMWPSSNVVGEAQAMPIEVSSGKGTIVMDLKEDPQDRTRGSPTRGRVSEWRPPGLGGRIGQLTEKGRVSRESQLEEAIKTTLVVL